MLWVPLLLAVVCCATVYIYFQKRVDIKDPTIGLAYDPRASQLESLTRFQTVIRHTGCLFARRSVNWGSPDWCVDKSLEDNVARCVPALRRMVQHSRAGVDAMYDILLDGVRTSPWEDLRLYTAKLEVLQSADRASKRSTQSGTGIRRIAEALARYRQRADGFVIEIRGMEYQSDILTFAHTVRRVLVCLHAHDEQRHRRISDNIGENWFMEFDREPLSVTCISSLYDVNSSRYQFADEENRNSCFLLFQPESALHLSVTGHGHTRSAMPWDAPETMRDKIRSKFRRGGRDYVLADDNEGAFPPHISLVHPEQHGGPIVEWWRTVPRLSDQSLFDYDRDRQRKQETTRQNLLPTAPTTTQ